MTTYRKYDVPLFIFLVAIQLIVAFVSPKSRFLHWYNACRIDEWTNECVPSARTALPWCGDSGSKDRVSALMRTMQTHHPAKAWWVPATCFGTNVQVYYMPKRKEYLINPKIVSEDTMETAGMECRGMWLRFHTAITVRYFNGYFKEQTTSFINTDAMNIGCELSASQ